MRQLIFRKSYYRALSLLNSQQQLQAYHAIMKYAFDDEYIKIPSEIYPLIDCIIESIDADFKKYEKSKESKNVG